MSQQETIEWLENLEEPRCDYCRKEVELDPYKFTVWKHRNTNNNHILYYLFCGNLKCCTIFKMNTLALTPNQIEIRVTVH